MCWYRRRAGLCAVVSSRSIVEISPIASTRPARDARAPVLASRIVAKDFLNPRTYAFSSVASTATDARRAMRALGRASSRRSSSHRLRSRVARASRARRVGAFERARHFFLFARRRASAPRRFARAARSAEAPRRASRLGSVNANRRFSDARCARASLCHA